MKTPEWSLIFFTVLIQFAVGAILFLSTVFGFSITRLESAIPKDYLVKFFLLIILIIAISLLSSFLHLGKPRNSLYAVTHFSSSWLSREIVFVLLFTISVCMLNFVLYKFNNLIVVKQALLITVAIFGILTLYSMIKVYMIPTVPAWNSLATPVRFFSTAIILGGISLVIFTTFLNKNAVDGLPFEVQKLIKIILLIIAIVAAINIVVYLFHISGLKSAGIAGLQSYKHIFESNLVSLYLWLGLNVLTLILIFYLAFSNSHATSLPIFILLAIVMFIVEIIGRHLFYAYYARVGI